MTPHERFCKGSGWFFRAIPKFCKVGLRISKLFPTFAADFTILPMHIAIAGNIGSGKTTLTTLLARRYGWTPHFETVKANPYLADFYKDPCRWAFNLEVFFLKERFKDALCIAQ